MSALWKSSWESGHGGRWSAWVGECMARALTDTGGTWGADYHLQRMAKLVASSQQLCLLKAP